MATEGSNIWVRTFAVETLPPILLQKSTVLITIGILLFYAIPLLLSAAMTILTTPGMTKKTLSSFVSMAIAGLPLGLSLIMTGLGAPFKVVILNGAMICSVHLYHAFTDMRAKTMKGVREERCSDPDHPICSTASRLAAQELRKMFFGRDLSKQAVAAATQTPLKTPSPQGQASATMDGQSDTSDNASTIFTPPPSDTEEESTSITQDLEDARKEKTELEAAEVDEEYKREMTRLHMEEAEHRYNNTAKWSDQREAHFLALEKCRRAYRDLIYLKEHKVFAMKKLALEIEYLEKKRMQESTEETNEENIAETK